jgi:hypothetical protein
MVVVIDDNASGSLTSVKPSGYTSPMTRTVKLMVLAALGALVVLAVVKLRATRQATSGLDAEGSLPGSFDTWPDVPRKQTA